MKYETLIKNLTKKRFNPKFFEGQEEALDYLLSIIPPKSTIGFGGSMTVKELNVLELLQNNGHTLYHNSLTPEMDKEKLYTLQSNADFYITSTNALSTTGDLINIDGNANRIASMVFGPKNVIVICGTNKIVDTIDEGIWRTRNVASPPNCVRLDKDTPCKISGHCHNCNSVDTICNATLIQHHPTRGKVVHIIIIDKNLGY